jgi:ferredoxin/flavodoxin---NADP+ reductase
MDHSVSVIHVQRCAPGIFELAVERPPEVAFVPGDCVAIYGPDGQASRPYSLASGQQEPVWRFLIREMRGGEISPYLATRQSGDRLQLSAPFGWFRPGPVGDGPFVFMATGTGIAPFLSYLHSHPACPPACCLYGVGQRADAVAAEWLRERVRLHLAVSREAAEDAAHGRLTRLLDEVPLGEAHHYYLCGLDAMIDEVSVWLEARAVPITHIHRECFFNAPV